MLQKIKLLKMTNLLKLNRARQVPLVIVQQHPKAQRLAPQNQLQQKPRK
jgi:hypothetical protein